MNQQECCNICILESFSKFIVSGYITLVRVCAPAARQHLLSRQGIACRELRSRNLASEFPHLFLSCYVLFDMICGTQHSYPFLSMQVRGHLYFPLRMMPPPLQFALSLVSFWIHILVLALRWLYSWVFSPHKGDPYSFCSVLED